MNNNKPWYEKLGIWITIIAGICAISGISIFGSKSLITNNEPESASITFKDNEISMGDRSAIVMGDNNTFNYGNADSDDTSKNESSISEEDDFFVSASYDMNTTQTSITGIDVLVKAKTSFSADHVTISAISDEVNETFNMHGGTYEWYFIANFYIKGTYEITVTAYSSDGQNVSDTFTYVY